VKHSKSEDSIRLFLRGVLLQRHRDRYIGFINKRKTQKKFLQILFHRFLSLVRPAAIAETLPRHAWLEEATGYSPSIGYGVPYETLADAYESGLDSILCISCDGRYGFYRPENRADDEVLLVATPE
jgi:hypothetical protein